MNSTVPPSSASRRASFSTSAASTGPSEEVGSSRISSRGERPQPLAISSSWRVGAGSSRTSRPSGTESKVKIYLQVVLPAAGRGDLAPLRAQAARRLAELREEVTEVLNL